MIVFFLIFNIIISCCIKGVFDINLLELCRYLCDNLIHLGHILLQVHEWCHPLINSLNGQVNHLLNLILFHLLPLDLIYHLLNLVFFYSGFSFFFHKLFDVFLEILVDHILDLAVVYSRLGIL